MNDSSIRESYGREALRILQKMAELKGITIPELIKESIQFEKYFTKMTQVSDEYGLQDNGDAPEEQRQLFREAVTQLYVNNYEEVDRLIDEIESYSQ